MRQAALLPFCSRPPLLAPCCSKAAGTPTLGHPGVGGALPAWAREGGGKQNPRCSMLSCWAVQPTALLSCVCRRSSRRHRRCSCGGGQRGGGGRGGGQGEGQGQGAHPGGRQAQGGRQRAGRGAGAQEARQGRHCQGDPGGPAGWLARKPFFLLALTACLLCLFGMGRADTDPGPRRSRWACLLACLFLQPVIVSFWHGLCSNSPGPRQVQVGLFACLLVLTAFYSVFAAWTVLAHIDPGPGRYWRSSGALLSVGPGWGGHP